MSRTARTVLVYLAVIFLVVMAVSTFLNQGTEPAELTLDEFNAKLDAGDIGTPVEMKEKSNEISGTCLDGSCMAGVEGDEFTLRYPVRSRPI